jgi:ubiquinone biosynthesis protein COQ4
MESMDDTTLHPWRALRSLLIVARDPEKTAVGARMVRSLEGRSRERLAARFAADPMGARILAEGRRLDRLLSDRAGLRALPLGSLGQAYEAWTRAEGISAEGLAEAGRQAGYLHYSESDDPAARVEARVAGTHDLWHVVTGYGRDLLGEVALLHFMLIQTRNTGLILPCWLGVAAPILGRAGRRLIFDARRRARRASWLPVADWEALLPEPLPAVRQRLRVGPPPRYAPVWHDLTERPPDATRHGPQPYK